MTAFPVGVLTEHHRAGSPSDRAWRVLAIASVVVAAVVSIVISLGASGPAFPYDEIDQLQMSRLLAGFDTPEVRGAGYFPAWAFLLAPLWWFTSDALVVYQAALWIGLVIGLAAIIPFAHIARRLRLTLAQGVFAGAVVVTLPAVAIQADYALSERLLLLVVALTTLAACRLWEQPRVINALVFSLAVGMMYFTHVRVLPVVIAAAVWLALFALRNWRVATIGLASLILFGLAANQLGNSLNVDLLGSFSQGETLLESLQAARPGVLMRSGLGQAWTQVVGTLGLAALGLVALTVWTWRELRRLRAGRAAFIFASIAGMYLLTTVKWASDVHLFTGSWRRLDTWLYGRYIDPLTSLLVLIGIALIIRGVRRSTVLWAGGISLAVILPAVLWLAIDAPTWAYVTPAHIPGITPWYGLLPDERFPDDTRLLPSFTNENRFWIYASLTTVVALGVILLLRRFRATLAVLLLSAAAAMSLVGDGASNDFRALESTSPAALSTVREALAETGPVDLQFATGCNPDGSFNSVTVNFYGFWLTPSVLSTYNATTEAPTGELIILCTGFEPEGIEGAVMIPETEWRKSNLWVAPGPLQDSLRAEGALP